MALSEAERKYQREYARTEKRRATRRAYLQTPNGKARAKADSLRWRAANREKVLQAYKRHDLKRYYGMTPEQWNELFNAQGRCCAGCGSSDPGRKNGQWSTDHCHKTGKVRGILCNGCNTALGQVKDDPDRLRKLAKYLEKGGAHHVCH